MSGDEILLLLCEIWAVPFIATLLAIVIMEYMNKKGVRLRKAKHTHKNTIQLYKIRRKNVNKNK